MIKLTYVCNGCGDEAFGLDGTPPGWAGLFWKPGLLRSRVKRPRHFCRACVELGKHKPESQEPDESVTQE